MSNGARSNSGQRTKNGAKMGRPLSAVPGLELVQKGPWVELLDPAKEKNSALESPEGCISVGLLGSKTEVPIN